MCLFSLDEGRLSSKKILGSRIFIDDEQTVFFLRRGKTLVGYKTGFALKAQRAIDVVNQIMRVLDAHR
jgi:hypothetical protein